jgi:hypothetical protein
MIRTFAVIAFFAARMIVAVFDLGTPEPSAGWKMNTPVNREAVPESPPIFISGLPSDSGTSRR